MPLEQNAGWRGAYRFAYTRVLVRGSKEIACARDLVFRLRKQHDEIDGVLLHNVGRVDVGDINSALQRVDVHAVRSIDLGECCDPMFDRLRRSHGRKEESAAEGYMALARADQTASLTMSITVEAECYESRVQQVCLCYG